MFRSGVFFLDSIHSNEAVFFLATVKYVVTVSVSRVACFHFFVKMLVSKSIGTMIVITALEFSCVRFSDCVQ